MGVWGEAPRTQKIYFLQKQLNFRLLFIKLMLLKSGIRENSGGIEISKNLIRLRRVAKSLQWGGVAVKGSGGGDPGL